MANREKQAEQRSTLLSRYCAELCANTELARSDLVTAFFWPDGDSGSVVAPDGSMASMTGSIDNLLGPDGE